MATNESRRPDWPAAYTTKDSRKNREPDSDPLFDRDWEVFVVRRDAETGDYATQTACCEGVAERA